MVLLAMYEMRLYLLNITKSYRDDEDGYTGEWFNCPVDFEEVKERLGVEQEEQIEIADYELPFSSARIRRCGKSMQIAAWYRKSREHLWEMR